MKTRLHPGGVAENIPTPEELDQTDGFAILKAAVEEIMAEIDGLAAALGATKRAAEPWDYTYAMEQHEYRKARLRSLLKVGGL